MYTGLNAKKERKRTKIEELQDEIKRLHKALGAMIHIHERLKNERIEGSEVAKLPTLSAKTSVDSKSTEGTLAVVPEDANREPTPGTDTKGA